MHAHVVSERPYDSSMIVSRLRSLSTAVVVGEFLRAGDPLGIDEFELEVRLPQNVVVLEIRRVNGGWLVQSRPDDAARRPTE